MTKTKYPSHVKKKVGPLTNKNRADQKDKPCFELVSLNVLDYSYMIKKQRLIQ